MSRTEYTRDLAAARATGVTNETTGVPILAAVAPSGVPARKPSRLWWWFVTAFVLQVGAWAAWFSIASQNRVEEVPLATSTVP